MYVVRLHGVEGELGIVIKLAINNNVLSEYFFGY